MPARGTASERLVRWGIPLALFAAAICIGLLYDPWRNPILDDLAIFAYRARMAAEGLPPHAGLYDAKSSLGILLGGAAIALGKLVGAPPLFALRTFSLAVYGLCAVATYALAAKYCASRTAGIIAGIIMLSFDGLARYAATSIEPKEVTVLCGVSALYFATRKRWFWVGLLAAGAGLAWQIGFWFVIVGGILVLAQARPRGRALLALGAGGLLALAAYSAYFVYYGAWLEMMRQSVIAPFIRAANSGFLPELPFLVNRFYAGYRGQAAFALVAIVGWLWQWRRVFHSRADAVRLFFTDPRTAGSLLAFHGLLLYTLLDFQNFPDLIPLLPFVALFAAYVLARLWEGLMRRLRWNTRTRRLAFALAALALFGLANLDVLLRPPLMSPMRLTWQAQAQAANELQARIGDAPFFSLGRDEVLFFLDRRPLTRYTFLVKNTDRYIELFEPGGFKGWLARVAQTQPASIAIKRIQRTKFYDAENWSALTDWLRREYVALRVCAAVKPGRTYVRAVNASLFPSAADRPEDACFSLPE